MLAGLRLEDVRIDLDQVTQGEKAENDYSAPYPSLHLSWKLAEGPRQLTASYSQRVQRPAADELQRLPLPLDPLTYRSGNPRLKPQVTQSFEAGYQYRKSGPRPAGDRLLPRKRQGHQRDHPPDLEGGAAPDHAGQRLGDAGGGLELVANGRLEQGAS